MTKACPVSTARVVLAIETGSVEIERSGSVRTIRERSNRFRFFIDALSAVDIASHDETSENEKFGTSGMARKVHSDAVLAQITIIPAEKGTIRPIL